MLFARPRFPVLGRCQEPVRGISTNASARHVFAPVFGRVAVQAPVFSPARGPGSRLYRRRCQER
eukprot:441780-Lingulodinium_polyedra.AAC.1